MSLIEPMLTAALAASATILDIYAGEAKASWKRDGSPVTEADARAEKIIAAHLADTGIPMLAEESAAARHVPELGTRFFCVDPLDGTKEFLKRNGEFTVNIALCEDGRPSQGVILAPATGAAFWGSAEGAWAGRVEAGRIVERRRIATVTDGPLRIVASRSHGHPALAALCALMAIDADVTVGSSLKFGLLASGAAQLYPRFGPTCEWDTAAGQAIVEAAGGVVLKLDGTPLDYGHRDRDFLNPNFVAAASPALALRAIAHIREIEASGPR